MSAPRTLYFRTATQIGYAVAEAYTGSFTIEDPYVLPDGEAGETALEILTEHMGLSYVDMGFSTPDLQVAYLGSPCNGQIYVLACSDDGAVSAQDCGDSGEIIKLSCCPQKVGDYQGRQTRRAYARAALPRVVMVSGIAPPGNPGSGLGGFTFSFGGNGVVVPPPNGPNTKIGTLSSTGGGAIVEH